MKHSSPSVRSGLNIVGFNLFYYQEKELARALLGMVMAKNISADQQVKENILYINRKLKAELLLEASISYKGKEAGLCI